MSKGLTYQHTIYASFTAYIVQAVINNFVPLLFLTFQSTYQIPLTQITLLVTLNFGFQLLVDFLAAFFVDKIGYRISIVAAHLFATAGLVGLVILPGLFANPFHGLLLAVLIYAAGGGLIEVLVSPIVEACPSEHKESTMSLLHSFYCWGHVGVVLISTIFFVLAGIENWRWLALFWAMIPFLNTFFFARVPLAAPVGSHLKGFSLAELLRNRLFWILVMLMIAAGASEQAVSQWASAFAEQGLGVSKTIGDLAGPMMFAVMMGLSRLYYGRYGTRLKLERFMTLSAIVCLGSYFLISLSPGAVLSLIGCAICGLAVGIMWPGTFSLSAARLPAGGTMMFAFLALAGDVGCAAGPTLVGLTSAALSGSLKYGILTAAVFPILLLVGIWRIHQKKKQAIEPVDA